MLGLDIEDIKKELIRIKPNIVGLTVVTPTVVIVKKIIDLIKEINKDTLVVVGGPHITVLHEELLDIADISVIGEGEETFLDIVDYYEGKLDLEDIKGIAYRDNNKDYINPKREFIEDLDKIPFPVFDLIDLSRYHHIYPHKLDEKYTTIITSRGCHHNCFFCSSSKLWGRKVRYRAIENVIKEIRQLQNRYNISEIFICDDIFGPCWRIEEFCQRLNTEKIKIDWVCHMRCDEVNEQILSLMKSAGCVEIQFGVESGNDEILKRSNKQLAIQQIKEAFRMSKKIKIDTWATFIIGLYGETKETFNKTIDLCKELDPTYATFLNLLPLPGSQIYNDYMGKGYIKISKDWSKYSWHNFPIFETEFLSKNDLIDLKKKAYLKFYLRPIILIRYFLQLIKTKSVKRMFRNILLFLKLSKNI